MLAFPQRGIKLHFIISVIATLFIIAFSTLTMCQALCSIKQGKKNYLSLQSLHSSGIMDNKQMYNIMSVVKEKTKGSLRNAVTFTLSPHSAVFDKRLIAGHAFPLKGILKLTFQVTISRKPQPFGCSKNTPAYERIQIDICTLVF